MSLSRIGKKDNISEIAKSIDKNDISQLTLLLSEKDDKIRYQALLLLKSRSLSFDDVYPFWDVFREKLKSDNSYQRSIGLMLIANNVRWDKHNQFENMFEEYFILLNDEKPITVRQFIQTLHHIIPYKRGLHSEIANRLMTINLLTIKETMRKLILIDVLDVLIEIRKYQTTDAIESYIFDALLGSLLDNKTKKRIKSML